MIQPYPITEIARRDLAERIPHGLNSSTTLPRQEEQFDDDDMEESFGRSLWLGWPGLARQARLGQAARARRSGRFHRHADEADALVGAHASRPRPGSSRREELMTMNSDQPIPWTSTHHRTIVETTLEQRSDDTATWGPVDKPGWHSMKTWRPGTIRVRRYPEHTAQQ
jgi:hypothetical protein